jgi:hypothetical protein
MFKKRLRPTQLTAHEEKRRKKNKKKEDNNNIKENFPEKLLHGK